MLTMWEGTHSKTGRLIVCVEREASNGGGLATGEENEDLAVSSYQCVGDELAQTKAQLLEIYLYRCLGRMMTML